MNYDNICSQIIGFDENVRFVGILDKNGTLKAGGYNKNTKKLLSEEEVKMSLHYAAERWEKRKNLSHKIGNERLSMTIYDKVKQFSIPINEKDLLLISTEPKFNHEKMISKVFELIKE